MSIVTCENCGYSNDLDEVDGDFLECIRCSESLPLPRPSEQGLSRSIGGGYQLASKIGEGGFGAVYFGYKAAADGFFLPVALKCPSAQALASGEARRALLREARYSERLRHPNIVRVLDAHETGPELYIVFEYYPSVNCSQLMVAASQANLQLPVPVAAWLIFQSLQGLAHAHDATDAQGKQLGLVHRDINPPNMLVGRDGQLKLADFGIAKATAQLNPDTTKAGFFKGKPTYCPPEAFRGERGPNEDLFAVAMSFWEMLALRRYYPDLDNMEILLKVSSEYEYCPIEQYRDDINSHLAAFFSRAMHPDPAIRYGNAVEMSSALESALGLARSQCEDIARGFFVQHPILFQSYIDREKLYSPSLEDLSSTVPPEAPTVELPVSSAQAPSLRDIPVVPARAAEARRRTPRLWLGLAALVLCFAGAGAYYAFSFKPNESTGFSPSSPQTTESALQRGLALCSASHPGALPVGPVEIEATVSRAGRAKQLAFKPRIAAPLADCIRKSYASLSFEPQHSDYLYVLEVQLK